MISSASGSKAKFKDFLRFHGEDEETREVQLTAEGFAALYGAVKKT